MQNVLITGASKGIGKATAIAFAKAGYNVIINYNNSIVEALVLEKELKDSRFSATTYRADVSNFDEVAKMINFCEEKYDHIDVLVNNAGIAQQKLFTDLAKEDWQNMMAVDLDGVFNTCRLVLPKMISRHNGKIVNISSIWGLCGASCEVAYSAAKAGVIGLTKALAKEVGPSNITVNAVAPGCIDTKMNSNLSDETKMELCDETPLCRFGSPEDIANTVLFLASPSADFITGQVISPNGGFVI